MSDNDKIKVVFSLIIMIPIFFLLISIEIYGWKHPEKTHRQIIIDLFEGKVFKYINQNYGA